jgi:phosphopantothenoylcysteine decarboxylase/phosphopantothenate--cysteine ligase
MIEPEEILVALTAWAQPKVLAGKRVLLTAGPTFEAIDPVRGVTNLSSGKMGFALAQACAEAGAGEVTLIAGPTSLPTPACVARVDVRSVSDMASAVARHVETSDIFIAVAAAADYAPADAKDKKIKKNAQPLTLTLKPTIDILATVASRPKPPFCVGFAAETNDVNENAEAKRRRKKVPLLIANRAQDALGQDENEVTLLDDSGAHPLPRMEKLALARRLVSEIAARMPKLRQRSRTRDNPA